ncbi:MAG TPA: hypothetical protein PK152_01350 [Anaerolineales bacterium]|nr:hypothetical protein [Anaerolineae bacterium]HRJ56514.1 hypothetical protein [Anaerolineales bacterium]HRK87748.1 hypothetical protein [Anaerolineales bacterium]
MSTQNENPFIKLIKKSVGLPTGKSDCCSTPAGQSSDCCGANASGGCCGAEGAQDSSAGCGCGDSGCGAEDEKESESAPTIGSSAI